MSTQPDKSSCDSQIVLEVEIAQQKMNLIGLRSGISCRQVPERQLIKTLILEILIDFNNFLVVLDYQNDSSVESGEYPDPLF
jgi:hypothetical protein